MEEVAAEIGQPVEYLMALRAHAAATVASLDSPTRDGDGSLLGDLIADDGPSVEEIAEESEQRRAVSEALDALPSGEEEVPWLRFGLGDGEPRTMEATARSLGMGRADVRRLEHDGLRRLRTPGEAGALRAG